MLELRQYLRALWVHWGESLGWAGTLSAAIVLAAYALGQPVVVGPSAAFVAFTTLVVAAFLAWRESWHRAGGNLCALTVAELVAPFDSMNAHTAETVVAQHYGKRFRAKNRIDDVGGHNFAYGVVVYLAKEGEKMFAPKVHLRVRRRMARMLNALPPGTVIAVEGTIERIVPESVTLSACRVLTIEGPPTT